MKARILACAAMAVGLLTTEASALTATIAETTPVVIDSGKDAFYVVEGYGGGNGTYHIYNNTSNLILLGFGVSNPLLTIATIDGSASSGFTTFSNIGDAYGFGGATYTGDTWSPSNLTAGNWTDEDLVDGLGDAVSAQYLFGDIGTALGGEGNANYFQVIDGIGLLPGQDGVDFGFSLGVAASFLFGVAVDGEGNTYAFITAPTSAVPLPAGAVLLISAIGGLGGLSLRKRLTRAA